MSDPAEAPPAGDTKLQLGVVVVTFNCSDIILDCLETLISAATIDGVTLELAVVDNASTDDTLARIEAWRSGDAAYERSEDMPVDLPPVPKPITGHRLHILNQPSNGGFAAGVNAGMAHLAAQTSVDRFWVLNPDTVVPVGTAAAFAAASPGPYSLMGGRLCYYDRPEWVQIDGGLVNRWTGVTGNANLFLKASECTPPAPENITFITGASMVVSRSFYETVGPMREDYFLYYEEVDWALRRGDLPLAVCPEAVVYHRAGSSIGSAGLGRPATPFALYFKNRARMRFMRRFHPAGVPTAWAYTIAKALQYRLKGWGPEAAAVLAGAREAIPDQSVMERLSPEAAEVALSAPALSAYKKIFQ